MKYKKVTTRHAVEMAVLFQQAGVKGKKLLEMYPQYSKASIYRHAKKDLAQDAPIDKRKFNKGRPSKLTAKDRRYIIRAIPKLRESDGTFTAPRVAVEAGLTGKVSVSTVRRALHKAGFRYRQSRKKGLLKPLDLKNRLKFCRKIKKRNLNNLQFWREEISFYFDGKGFQYKMNPQDQARAPRAREWRRRNEGLNIGCTAKGSKEGAVNANFMVAISYNHGVVLCEQYHGAINGDKMVHIVYKSFEEAFRHSNNPRAKRLLMDGCPRQNCGKALAAISDVGGKVFSIPSRSPDLNPIENVFNLVSRQLKLDAVRMNITRETFEEFSSRVRSTLLNFSVVQINNIIDSMERRVDMIIQSGGNRIRY